MKSMFADISVTADPTWPWSLPGLGLGAFILAASGLAILTIYTYLGSREVNFKRILAVLALRLGALVVACLLTLRPSLTWQDEEKVQPSRIIVFLDASESMNITDEFNGQSRWDYARRILFSSTVADVLKMLAAEQKIEVVYYQGDDEVRKLDIQSRASAKRSLMGKWLTDLYQLHARDGNLRSLVFLSDGADNGDRSLTLSQAKQWRELCSLQAFGLGRPTTTTKHRDLALVDIKADPSPVPVKGVLNVQAKVNAPGFLNPTVNVRLEIDGKPAEPNPLQQITLLKSEGNLVNFFCNAPNKPGDIKVTVKVDPLPEEVTAVNNEISTFVPVSREGLSVLWVEGKKRLESSFIILYALAQDPRFRVHYTEKPPLTQPSGGEGRVMGPGPTKDDWYDLDGRHYDVIVIGDISASRFSDKRPEIFQKIKTMVEDRGVGLMMLGGRETFANSDWHDPFASALASLLPVVLDRKGQFEPKFRLTPTGPGQQHYLMRLHEDPKKNEEIWEQHFERLTGMTYLGTVKPAATVLARRDDQDPVLVYQQVGGGRVLAFGADTTHQGWRRDKEAVQAFSRFWRQVILWLGRQDESDSDIRIAMETRRLPAGQNKRLEFEVDMRGKNGEKLKDLRFKAKVLTPDKEEIPVDIALVDHKYKGYFWKTDLPGDYRLEVSGEGKDAAGVLVTSPAAAARFLCYAEDLENLRPAADRKFMEELADAGGGRFHQAEEHTLLKFLEELQTQKKEKVQARGQQWPDWRRNPDSRSLRDQVKTLWQSTALVCLVLFLTFLCLEWYLRRRWGMV